MAEDRDTLRERLAALEHEQWAHIMACVLDMLHPILLSESRFGPYSYLNERAAFELVNRWKRQIVTAYADLTEQEKDADREWADMVLALLELQETIEVNELLNDK